MFPAQAPRVSSVRCVPNPSLPCSDAGRVRARSDERAELESDVVVNSDYKVQRSQTRGLVLAERSRSLSVVSSGFATALAGRPTRALASTGGGAFNLDTNSIWLFNSSSILAKGLSSFGGKKHETMKESRRGSNPIR